ncbi:MAG: hypothetical protein FWF33_02490 [Clostridiales bacterium]|nr:hypothetical protein [Clostridiales bacterium]
MNSKITKTKQGAELLEFLESYAAGAPVSFHMPGHKGAAFFERFGYGDFVRRLPDMDITEIPGADNLHRQEGVLAELAARCAALYGVRASHLLVNGSTAGILAAVLTAVPRGGKLICARGSHRSTFSAAALGGIELVFAEPGTKGDGLFLPDHCGGAFPKGLGGVVQPEEIERLARAHPDASAVILPSPDYFGFCADIAAIAEITHAAGMTLIVDQAHGAHLKFFAGTKRDRPLSSLSSPLPLPAEEQGADLVVDSIHKTLASFTQSAVLNVCSERADTDALAENLRRLQSTSPSYLLLASLDMNARILAAHGPELFREWAENLAWFYGAAGALPKLRVVLPQPGYDYTKINIDFGRAGLTGEAAQARLIRECGIYPELCAGSTVMFLTGIGNTRAHYETLLDALRPFG